jgi:hypothetical protein
MQQRNGVFYAAVPRCYKQGTRFELGQPIFSPEWVLHKGYDHKGSVKKNVSGRESQGTDWR